MLTPGFIAAHSHRLEDLTDLTVRLLAQYPLAPFEEEVILVQSNGIAQWLKQAIAEHSGIATMLEVTLPARLVWRAYRAVLGQDIPRQSPYDKTRLRWRLLRLLPNLIATQADFSALQRYVAHDPDQRKLFQLSDKLADLLDQYQVYRADWLDAWSKGQFVISHRGEQQPLPEQQRWQALLWQALVNDIGAEQICSNRAALHQRFIEKCAQLTATGKRPAGIPPRIVVFGISSLPRQTLEVLHALKGLCQVVLCVHNPCKYHWADIVDARDIQRQAARSRFVSKNNVSAAASPAELHDMAQPLLASWGKQGRDYIRLLDEFDETALKASQFTELRFDLFDEDEATTLLAQLQSDILNLRPPTESQQCWPAYQSTDHSIIFQRCHSPQREIEVLHDHLLAAFAADPQLQPRDIMVMVPDINRYAPYIDAVFGKLQPPDKRAIPYTIADQGLRQRSPLLQALELILSAPQQRFLHSDVFDLLHVPAIQRRFGVSQQQVSRLQQWSLAAGARWGLDATQRQTLGLEHDFAENSWQFAFNRMLYGYASGELTDNHWLDIEPYAEVAGIEAQAAGALAELLHQVHYYWQALSMPRTPAEWHPLLSQLLEQLFVASNDAEQLLLTRLRDTLDEWLNSTTEAGFNGLLRYNIIAEVWLSAVDEPNLQQRFMAGSVNFATLMPMRAIPFKRVCLLGMNDADYPRTAAKTDFDLMVQFYRAGDRSRREDDRYLFLEALLSAREQLYISWVGMSVQDNSDQPPSVLVGQLQDHLDATWCDANPVASDASVSQQVTRNHSLQPFAARYFSGDHADYYSYAREWLSVHSTLPTTLPKQALAAFSAEAAFSLSDMVLLLKEPAQLLARRRLGVYLDTAKSEDTDNETFSSQGLQAWQVKDEMLSTLRKTEAAVDTASDTLTRLQQQLRRRGHLPYGHGADELLAQSQAAVLALYQYYIERVQGLSLQKTRRYQLNYTVNGQNYSLEDELSSLYLVNSTAQVSHYLQLDLRVNKVAEPRARSVVYTWRNIVPGYIKHMFACAVLNNSEVSTVIIGEGAALTLPPLAQPDAQAILQQLIEVTLQALSTPLPTALALAEVWFKYQQQSADKLSAALSNSYLGSDYDAGQNKKLVYLARHYQDIATLLAHGLVRYSEQLYLPLFELGTRASVTPIVTSSDKSAEEEV